MINDLDFDLYIFQDEPFELISQSIPESIPQSFSQPISQSFQNDFINSDQSFYPSDLNNNSIPIDNISISYTSSNPSISSQSSLSSYPSSPDSYQSDSSSYYPSSNTFYPSSSSNSSINYESINNNNNNNTQTSLNFSNYSYSNTNNTYSSNNLCYYPLSSSVNNSSLNSSSLENASISSQDTTEHTKKNKNKNDKVTKSDSNNKFKKKKSTYIRVNQFPIIIKRDFRRYFAQMMANVTNSYDLKLLYDFTHHFFSSNTLYLAKFNYASPISDVSVSNNTIFSLNINDSLLFHLYQMVKSPDKVYRIDDVKLIQLKDNENTILTYVGKLSLTQMYDVSNYPKRLKNKIFEMSNRDEYVENLIEKITNDYDNFSISDNNINKKYDKDSSHLEIYKKIMEKEIKITDVVDLVCLKNPIKIEIVMKTKIIFNSNKKIIGMFTDQLCVNYLPLI